MMKQLYNLALFFSRLIPAILTPKIRGGGGGGGTPLLIDPITAP